MSSFSYAGRTVVITGVARAGQVGEALAVAFATAGAGVAILDRDAEGLAAREAELRAHFPESRITAHACDLTSAASTGEAVDMVRSAHGGEVHALVNAAGGFAMSGEVALSEPDLWQKMFAINLTTAYVATRAFLPMLRAGRGAICYFGSTAALPGGNGARMAAYAAAKAGVLSLMQSVAEEERGNGVRANALVPTAVRTAQNERDMGPGANYVEREEIARLALWICAPDGAEVVTGQAIVAA